MLGRGACRGHSLSLTHTHTHSLTHTHTRTHTHTQTQIRTPTLDRHLAGGVAEVPRELVRANARGESVYMRLLGRDGFQEEGSDHGGYGVNYTARQFYSKTAVQLNSYTDTVSVSNAPGASLCPCLWSKGKGSGEDGLKG